MVSEEVAASLSAAKAAKWSSLSMEGAHESRKVSAIEAHTSFIHTKTT